MDRKLSALSPLLALVLVVFASAIARAQTSQDQTVPAAVRSLEAIVINDVYSLERDMVGFHWEAQSGGWEPKGMSDVQHHILNWPAHFFDPNSTTFDNIGPGIYLATDPLVTRSYGGADDSAELYVVTVKQGAKMLNATRELSAAEIQTANKFLSDFSCGSPAVQPDKLHTFTDLLLNTFINSSLTCRNILQSVMKDLGVEAILYTYTSSYLPHCRTDGYAVNIISANAVKANEMAFYDGQFLLETSPVAGLVRRAWHEAMSYDVSVSPFLHDDQSHLPTTLRSSPVSSDADYAAWKSKFYSCGSPWIGEEGNSNLNATSDMVRTQYFDSELRDLELQLPKAMLARGQFGYIQYYYLRVLSTLSYKASGWAPDDSKFGQWNQALTKMREIHSTNDFIAIEALLEEPTTVPPNLNAQDYIAKIANTFKPEDAQNPNVIFAAIRRAGMGPRLQRMYANALIASAGGAPYLGELPQDLSTPIVDTIKANKETIKSALRECIKTYEDLSIAQDQLTNGPCGLNM